jgi:hypothetical protein
MRRGFGAWRSLVSALVWGTRGREFKSPRSDHRSSRTQPHSGFGTTKPDGCECDAIWSCRPVRVREAEKSTCEGRAGARPYRSVLTNRRCRNCDRKIGRKPDAAQASSACARNWTLTSTNTNIDSFCGASDTLSSLIYDHDMLHARDPATASNGSTLVTHLHVTAGRIFDYAQFRTRRPRLDPPTGLRRQPRDPVMPP